MRKVMVFGTFDGIHAGHRNLFAQAIAHGEYLIVVVARDRTVKEVKGRPPKYDEADRLSALLQEDIIDEVVLGYDHDDKHQVIDDHKPHAIVLGYDQDHFVSGLHKKVKDCGIDHTKIIRAKAHHPNRFKSSKM